MVSLKLCEQTNRDASLIEASLHLCLLSRVKLNAWEYNKKLNMLAPFVFAHLKVK